jgi:methyltransferase (TIGR00027 family)
MSKRTIEYQPSETAMATCFLRALAAHDERAEIRGADDFAELFLPEERAAPLKDAAARQWIMNHRLIPGMYEFIVARTAFFDDAVQRSLRDNIPQMVILGAGYDSRPYRFQRLIQETRIFELDAAPIQRRKQEVLHQANLGVPKQIVFVPVNFDRDGLSDVLLNAGFDRSREALFVWEGVTYYLSARVVDATLSSIRSVALAGSTLCFDYAALSSKALEEDGVTQLRERLKSNYPGEPASFGIPAGIIESFLASRGYAIREHLTPSEAASRYLTLHDGSLAGRLPGLFCLVRAIVLG